MAKTQTEFNRAWLKKKGKGYEMWNSARYRAKLKNIEFTITEEDIVIPKYCPILGLELKPGKGYPQATSPSIHRIDSSRGYTPDNIIICSWRANNLLKDATLEEMKTLTRWLNRQASMKE